MHTRVMIVDDHAIIRDGLRKILEEQEDICVVGEAADGNEAIAKAREVLPHVILMDIAMPGMNGIEAMQVICEQFPATKVIILSMHHTREHIFRALKAQAAGYILKESAGTEVVRAVRGVIKGQRYLGRGIDLPGVESREVWHTEMQKSPLESLSHRERQVMQLVVEGKTSAEIADLLALSPKSVETYRSRLMLKLGVANIAALVKFALSQGITPA